jgi:hypothetical protein
VWLAFVLMLMIFHHPKAKLLYGELSCEKKKMLATLQASFVLCHSSP